MSALSNSAVRRIQSFISKTAELTHRRKTEQLSDYVMLFSDDEDRNAHYGPHVWTLKTDLPYVEDDPKLLEFTMNFYNIDEDTARHEVNPEDIVDTAGAWDDPQFVSEVWEALSPVGYTTQDGAVVLDKPAVELDYHYEDDNDW